MRAGERIDSVQFLRGVAATAVAMGHALAVASKVGYKIGFIPPTGAGVDLFFFISGFIMVLSSKNFFNRTGAWRTFLKRRLIRVAPMYWGATLIFVCLLAIDARHGGEFPGPWALLTSFLFIPSTAFKSTGGVPYPILAQGWTLNYEMFFYILFAVSLSLKRTMAVAAATGFLLLLTIGIALRPTGFVPLDSWGQAIVLEFAAGMILAVLRAKGLALPTSLRVFLAIAGVVWLVAQSGFPGPGVAPYGFARLSAWGLPCLLFLAATVLGPDYIPEKLEKPVKLFGDASYSYYLLHPIVYVVVQHSGFRIAGPLGVWFYVPLLFVLGAIVSFAAHWFVERRILVYLGKIKRREPEQPLPPSERSPAEATR